MVMNEAVAQNLLKLNTAVLTVRARPNSENLKAAGQAFTKHPGGPGNLEQAVGPVIRPWGQLAGRVRESLKAFQDRHDQSLATQMARREILAKWDRLTAEALKHLEKTMKEVIDPQQRSGAAGAKDIAAMNLWGDIDMVMNEAVIANFLKLVTSAHDYVALETPANLQRLGKSLQTIKAGLSEWREVIKGQAAMEDAAGVLDQKLKAYEALMADYQQKAGQDKNARAEMNRAMQNSLAELQKGMEHIIDPSKEAAVRAAENAQASTAFFILLFSAAAVVLGVVLAWLISRSIIKPLSRIIQGLGQGAGEVAMAAGQVNRSGQSLAQGASEQAASLEETSASMEEMASMTQRNADNSGQADDLMKKAADLTRRAKESMAELKKAMDNISSASGETMKIIDTINTIAFQTNLLALNAAVEAARAGEAGSGFAVVADEVRALAIRASEAAKSTAELIQGNVHNIETGAKMAYGTGQAFEDMAGISEKVSGLIAEIAGASREQSLGIDQVNQAMTDLSRATQKNAAVAEESSAASSELDSQAVSMEDYVNELAAMVGAKTGEGKGRKSLKAGAAENGPEITLLER